MVDCRHDALPVLEEGGGKRAVGVDQVGHGLKGRDAQEPVLAQVEGLEAVGLAGFGSCDTARFEAASLLEGGYFGRLGPYK